MSSASSVKVSADSSYQALFNVMLREFGVKGVKVQEVISLDEEMMAFLEYELLVPSLLLRSED